MFTSSATVFVSCLKVPVSGGMAWVNLAHLQYILPNGEGCVIYMRDSNFTADCSVQDLEKIIGELHED